MLPRRASMSGRPGLQQDTFVQPVAQPAFVPSPSHAAPAYPPSPSHSTPPVMVTSEPMHPQLVHQYSPEMESPPQGYYEVPPQQQPQQQVPPQPQAQPQPQVQQQPEPQQQQQQHPQPQPQIDLEPEVELTPEQQRHQEVRDTLREQMASVAHLPPEQQIDLLIDELAKVKIQLRDQDQRLLFWNTLLRGDGRPYTFLEACEEGRLPLVTFFLSHGADLEQIETSSATGSFRTGLMHAVSKGHTEVARFLMLSGADVNGIGKFKPEDRPEVRGNTPLIEACLAGRLEMVNLLLEHGADAGKENFDGMSPIIAAAQGGSVGVLDRLVSAGAHVDAYDGAAPCGTALYAATKRADLEMVKALLERNAKLLQEHIDSTFDSSELIAAAQSSAGSSLEVAKLLVRRGANVNAGDATERLTPLMYAARNNHHSMVRFLLEECHADPNLVSESGFTALMAACQFSALGSAWQLLMYGADPNLTPEASGLCPLTIAVCVSNRPSPNVVELLVMFGANPNAPDLAGYHALASASEALRAAARKGIHYQRHIHQEVADVMGAVAKKEIPDNIVRLCRFYLPGVPVAPQYE